MGKRLHGTGNALFLFLLVSSVSFAADHVSAKSTPCDPWAAKIASIQGNVEAKRTSQSDWQAVTLNDIYCPGDQIRVGDNARAAIVLNNETLVRLNQNSAITLADIKNDGPSLLELLEGIAHFISRVPRSLKVNTPFVNAAIEGTEFVVAIKGKQTEVTVFEGIVLTQNSHGELRVHQNETAVASANSAPQKVLKATPRDAVQWALYFPPIFDNAQGKLAKAQQYLFAGQVEKARAAVKDEQSAEALSLLAIIAVVQNESDTAVTSASQAVDKAPQLAAAHIALSYAWQAKRDLDRSLASAQRATQTETDNALAWARLAELQLSTGELSDALQSAQRATQLNPNLARTQTILGYAYLLKIDIEQATTTFTKAIELDQVDPLPRLGLGLAKIRQNDLAEGRRDIEIAASLDPNNAVIRSYLGKAYYEEKRGPLDAEQFAMAKELDPNDPTPWFYDAIRKQTENDPVGALEDLNKSIELNDNRAVYRSSLQLDQDEAARNVSLARIYQNLGVSQVGLDEATKSILQNPSSHSAHKFLSDIYSLKQRHEVARTSELLQSRLLQDLSGNPVRPQTNETNLNLVSSIGISDTSLNEYESLFVRDQPNLIFSTIVGSNKLLSNDLVVHGLYDNLSYSFGQFNYNTDGYRAGADVNHDISNAFIQYNISSNLSIQYEHQNRRTDQGDLAQSLDPDLTPDERRTLNEKTNRLGLKYSPTITSTLLFSIISNDRLSTLIQQLAPTPPTVVNTGVRDENEDYQLQYIFSGNKFKFIAGAGNSKIDDQLTTLITAGGFPVFNQTTLSTDKQNTYYSYGNIELFDDFLLTLGLNYEDIESQIQNINVDEVNPKLGFLWQANNSISLRMAAFETVKRNLVSNQTLEPTQISGFNQFFDELNLSKSRSYGFGIDTKLTSNISFGLEALTRDLSIPQYTSPPPTTSYQSQDETYYTMYFHWTVSPQWSLGFDFLYEKLKNDTKDLAKLDTLKIPFTLKYFNPSGLYSTLKISYIDQEGLFTDPVTITRKSDFNVVDLILGYHFPKRKGQLSLQVNNIFNENFLYESSNTYNADKFNITQEYLPEQTINVVVTLFF